MRWLLVLLVLLPFPASAQRGVVPATRALRASLEAEYSQERATHRVVTRTDAASYGTVVTASFEPPLYPGTGIASVIVGADGHSYGRRGQRDFADLARALGWLTTMPTVELFYAALNSAQFDGLVASRQPGTIALTGGVLRFTFRRAEPMSGDEVETMVIEIRAAGPMTITRVPISTD